MQWLLHPKLELIIYRSPTLYLALIPGLLPCLNSVHNSVDEPLMNKVPGVIHLTYFPSPLCSLLSGMVNFLCVTLFSVYVDVAS